MALNMEMKLRASIERKESRGAQCRTDYPARDDAHYRKTTLARCTGGRIDIAFAALPEEEI